MTQHEDDRRVIIWDFDGTLAERPGLWAGCILEVLAESDADHGFTSVDFKDTLDSGFPWHLPDELRLHLREPTAWWAEMEMTLAKAIQHLGFSPARAGELATLTRYRFIDGTKGWRVFPDTVPVLTRLRELGWRHAVLSNHVPELPALMEILGLRSYFDTVLSSALMGYDKPHPMTYQLALEATGNPATVWMIGDNSVADVTGPTAFGIPAILVRRQAAGVMPFAPDLYGVIETIARGVGDHAGNES